MADAVQTQNPSLKVHFSMNTDATSYLIFELDAVLYGLQASAVRETLPLPQIAPLHHVRAPWLGALDVRGRLLPILDTRVLLGGAPRRLTLSDNVVLVQSGDDVIGLVVGAVREVRAIPARDLEVLPRLQNASQQNIEVDAEVSAGAVFALARVDGALVQLLRADALRALANRTAMQTGALPSSALDADADVDVDAPGERALFEARAHALRLPFASATGEIALGQGATQSASHDVFAHETPQSETPRATAQQDTAQQDTLQFAAVTIGRERFAISLQWVREFTSRLPVTPVPRGPRDVLGLVNLRGEIVPLLDLRFALQLPLSDGVAAGHGPVLNNGHAARDLAADSAQIVFVECDGVRLGLAVDGVLDIVSARENQLLPIPVSTRAAFVRAALFDNEKTLAVLDLRKLLQEGGWSQKGEE